MFGFEIVATPTCDFDKLLGAVLKTTGEAIAETADRGNVRSAARKLAICLAAFAGQQPSDGHPVAHPHLHFAGLLFCGTGLVPAVTAACGGLAVMTRPTSNPLMTAAILSGNLSCWVAAVAAGRTDTDRGVAEIFARIHGEFAAIGFSAAFHAPPTKANQIKRLR